MYNFWENFPKGLTVGKEVNRRPFFAVEYFVFKITSLDKKKHLQFYSMY